MGGLVGLNQKDALIEDCYAQGDVESYPEENANAIGGLVGRNSGMVTGSYAVGEVWGNNSVGGLAGTNSLYGTITISYATGTVQGTGERAGGLVGLNSNAVNNSYATGAVNGNENVGGLVGRNDDSITNCYSAGPVSGETGFGGLVGNNNGTVETSFWDIDYSELEYSDGGEGKGHSEMIKKDTFEKDDWDFNTVWDIEENKSYPYLQWQEGSTIPHSPDPPYGT